MIKSYRHSEIIQMWLRLQNFFFYYYFVYRRKVANQINLITEKHNLFLKYGHSGFFVTRIHLDRYSLHIGKS